MPLGVKAPQLAPHLLWGESCQGRNGAHQWEQRLLTDLLTKRTNWPKESPCGFPRGPRKGRRKERRPGERLRSPLRRKKRPKVAAEMGEKEKGSEEVRKAAGTALDSNEKPGSGWQWAAEEQPKSSPECLTQ